MTPHRQSDDEARFAEAARWQARLRGDANPEARQSFEHWLRQDARHPAAMEEADALSAAFSDAARVLEKHPTFPAHSRRRHVRLAAAASLAAFVVAAFWFAIDVRHDETTQWGQTRALTLSDGTKVILAPGSAVNIRISDRERRIFLARGEAFFRVAHDVSRPFTVSTPGAEAKVLGTVFDVRVRAEGVRVGVEQGRVAVRAGHADSDVLTAGLIADLTADGVHRVHGASVASTTAWTRSQLMFFNAPLQEVMDELGRYRPGMIWLRGDAVKKLAVSGAFNVRDPETTLDAIVASLGLRSFRAGPWITVVSAK